MIVTACAPVLDPRSRSRSMAAVLAAIAAAAEQLRAPDLIVLPDCFLGGGCDGVSAAMCVGFCETIGRAAREWGVWIAVGHPTRIAGKLVSAATVYDPDADPYIHFPQARCLPPGVGARLPAPGWSVGDTPLGRWALRTGQTLPTPPDWEFHGAGLAILPLRRDDAVDACAWGEVARTTGCAVCFAAPRLCDDRTAPASPLAGTLGADGKPLAVTRGERMATAELHLPVPVARAFTEELGTLE